MASPYRDGYTASQFPTAYNSNYFGSYVHGDYNNPYTPGSMAHDAYETSYNTNKNIQSFTTNIKNAFSAAKGAANDAVGELHSSVSAKNDTGLDPNGVDWIGYYENSPASSASSQISPTDYELPYSFMDTSLASLFGMDAATHYQEALANTAYQRQIRDLKAAGLNPVLGMSGNGAAVFRGVEGSFGSYGSSGGSGVSLGSVGSGKSAAQIAYKLGNVLPGLANAAASLGVVVATKGKGAYYAPTIGFAAQNATTSILNAIKNFS